jgi:putative transposase
VDEFSSGLGKDLCGSRLQPRRKKGPTDWALARGGADVGRIARRVRQAGVYFVTTDTWQKHPLFINTALANIVVEQIVSCRDRGFYALHAFVLMPDHLHVLLTPGETTTVEKPMQMIKGGSAHRIGIEKPQNFPIWHSGFHDRWMRDADEYRGSKHYIEQNPVEAKLVERPEDYAYSSANGKYVLDLSRFEEVSG